MCVRPRTPFTGGAVMHTGAAAGPERRRRGSEAKIKSEVMTAGRAKSIGRIWFVFVSTLFEN